MAVAFSNGYHNSATSWTTLDVTATVNSGEALLIAIEVDKSSITSVVWDPAGVNEALTLKDSTILNGSYYGYIYGKLNPTAGASKPLRITIASGNGGGCAATYTGTNLTYGNNNHDDQNTDTPCTFSPVTANNNAWIVMCAINPTSNTLGAGTGSNLRGATDYFGTLGLFDSGNKASAGTQSMAITHAAGFTHTGAAWVEIYEGGGAATVFGPLLSGRAFSLVQP